MWLSPDSRRHDVRGKQRIECESWTKSRSKYVMFTSTMKMQVLWPLGRRRGVQTQFQEVVRGLKVSRVGLRRNIWQSFTGAPRLETRICTGKRSRMELSGRLVMLRARSVVLVCRHGSAPCAGIILLQNERQKKHDYGRNTQ